MRRIFCTDIFGHTDAVDRLIASFDHQIDVISPFADTSTFYHDEKQAYQAFSNAGGVEAYARQLSAILVEHSLPVRLVGFSAGASAAYVALNRSSAPQSSKLLGFYPGQIRHYLSIQNRYDATLVFPASEAHFNLVDVRRALNNQKQLTQIGTYFQHGFMNPLSQGFNRAGFTLFADKINAFLSEEIV